MTPRTSLPNAHDPNPQRPNAGLERVQTEPSSRWARRATAGSWRTWVSRCQLTGSIWLAMVTSGWAQEAAEEQGKTYVPSYMIIIFAVGLALLMICRAGKRSLTFRRD